MLIDMVGLYFLRHSDMIRICLYNLWVTRLPRQNKEMTLDSYISIHLFIHIPITYNITVNHSENKIYTITTMTDSGRKDITTSKPLLYTLEPHFILNYANTSPHYRDQGNDHAPILKIHTAEDERECYRPRR